MVMVLPAMVAVAVAGGLLGGGLVLGDRAARWRRSGAGRHRREDGS